MRTTLLALSVLAVLGGCDQPQQDATYSLPIGVALRGAVDQVLPPLAWAPFDLTHGNGGLPSWGTTHVRAADADLCFVHENTGGCVGFKHIVYPFTDAHYVCTVFAVPPGVTSKDQFLLVTTIEGKTPVGGLFGTLDVGADSFSAPSAGALNVEADPTAELWLQCGLTIPTNTDSPLQVSSLVGLRVAPVVSTYDPVLGLTGEPGYEWRPFVDVAMGHSQSYSVEGAQ